MIQLLILVVLLGWAAADFVRSDYVSRPASSIEVFTAAILVLAGSWWKRIFSDGEAK